MTREHSSAGSEHLPYKQGVIGSNPIVPTEKPQTMWLFSCTYGKYIYNDIILCLIHLTNTIATAATIKKSTPRNTDFF